MKETDEPMLPVFKHYLDTFNVRPLAATECLKVCVRRMKLHITMLTNAAA